MKTVKWLRERLVELPDNAVVCILPHNNMEFADSFDYDTAELQNAYSAGDSRMPATSSVFVIEYGERFNNIL